MSSYRFCRTDDIPLLCDAYERCYRPEFPDWPALDPPAFKRRIRELNLWCSSCMVTIVAGEPAGVMLATKRDDETLIWAIGVRRSHRRQEHGSHMLRSLSAKLAILGPPRLVAELPAELLEARAFFEACGYAEEGAVFDYRRAPSVPESFAAPLAQPVTVEELDDAGLLQAPLRRCWERSAPSIRNVADRVSGLAVPSFDGYAAWLLWRDVAGERRILQAGDTDPSTRDTLLGMLLRQVAADGSALRIPRVAEGELPHASLRAWGFERDAETRVLTAIPRPA